MVSPYDVIAFWFEEHGPDDWFAARAEFDAEIASRFAETHGAVARGEAWEWRATPRGRLAEIIVLDQFSRQIHRGRARAFAQDGMALVLAQEAVAHGADRQLATDEERMFLYMPFMHSESLLVHEWAMRLFMALSIEGCRKAAEEHIALIRRFGRYPKRNVALGRTSTPEELAYLAEAGDGMI